MPSTPVRTAVLLLVACLVSACLLSACGKTVYVDSEPGNQPEKLVLGWKKVDPVEVTVPTEGDSLTASTSKADAKPGAEPVIVNVWASFCVPCKKELPLLERVDRSGKVHVVGLSRDVRRSYAEDSLQKAQVTYPNWMDGDATFAVSLDGLIPLNMIPSSVLMVDGKVVAVHLGDFKTVDEVLAGLALD